MKSEKEKAAPVLLQPYAIGVIIGVVLSVMFLAFIDEADKRMQDAESSAGQGECIASGFSLDGTRTLCIAYHDATEYNYSACDTREFHTGECKLRCDCAK